MTKLKKDIRKDTYYWNVTVPKLRAKLEKKYPMSKGKLGVYHPLPTEEHDSESWRGMLYRRTHDLLFDD